MAEITEPNWDSLGDKELAAIIRSRTGEIVVPGRMAHATLVAKAQQAFRRGAAETEMTVAGASAAAPVETADARDTRPSAARHGGTEAAAASTAPERRPASELAESASGNPTTEAHPERRAMGMPEPAPKPSGEKDDSKKPTAPQKR